MSSTPNPLFQYFPSTADGRVCSTCQAPFGPKTGNSTMRRHLQRTHPQQMQQYISQGGSVPGSTPAKVRPPGTAAKGRKSAPPSVQSAVQDDAFNGIASAAAASASSSSPLAPALPPLPQLPLLVAPTFGLAAFTAPASSLAASAPASSNQPAPSTASSSSSSLSSSASSSPPALSAFTPPGTSIGVPFSDLSLEQLRLSQQHFSNERQWLRFHTPRNLALALVGEVGELAELFQWREDDSTAGLPAWTAAEKEALGEELSDVLLYLVRLSDRCGIDLSAAVQRKQAVNADKYPAKRVRGRSDKYSKYGREEGKDSREGREGREEQQESAVNGETVVEVKKQRKKRTRSTEPTPAGSDAQESKQDDHKQPTEMDDRKEPEEARA